MGRLPEALVRADGVEGEIEWFLVKAYISRQEIFASRNWANRQVKAAKLSGCVLSMNSRLCGVGWYGTPPRGVAGRVTERTGLGWRQPIQEPSQVERKGAGRGW